MRNKIVLLLFITTSVVTFAQQKQLWATSYIGKKAPDFVVEEWLSEVPDTKGKYVLIDFWATWCGPCRKAIPKLNAFQKKFKDQLVVIGVSDESRRKVERFNNPKITYFNAVDRKGRMYRKLGIQGIPHVIIVNPEGIVVWEGYPFLKGFELTEKVVAELLP